MPPTGASPLPTRDWGRRTQGLGPRLPAWRVPPGQCWPSTHPGALAAWSGLWLRSSHPDRHMDWHTCVGKMSPQTGGLVSSAPRDLVSLVRGGLSTAVGVAPECCPAVEICWTEKT